MNNWTEVIYDRLVQRLETLPHAILVYGPRGLGKLEMARSFVQRILCERGEAGRLACGVCDGCRWFLSGQHPDYRQIEPEALAGVAEPVEESDRASAAQKKKPSTEIKVEQVRGLADFLAIGSHRARRRVALFHPAEAMNVNAANALLKGLEEPAPAACLILVSHEPRRLLPTIRSRCSAFPVRLPDRASGVRWLATQGVAEPEAWLALAGGAPCAAHALATSDAGTKIGAWRKLLDERPGDLAERFGIAEREQLEPLVEFLQKWAYDRAAENLGVPGNYGLARKPAPGVAYAEAGRAWLEYARKLGRARFEARHPVNPKLFLFELVAALPESDIKT